MRPEQIAEMWTEIARVGKPGSRIVFRTAATTSPVETALPPALKAKFDYKEALSRPSCAKTAPPSTAASISTRHC